MKSFPFANCLQMYRLKVLTFDVYNTLIRVYGSPSHQYAKVAKSFGINIPEADIEGVYEKTWRQKKHDHPAYGKHHGISERDWWIDFVFRVFTAAGYHGSAESLRPMTDALIKHLDANSPAREIMPHAVDCLERFKLAGLTLGVVSNADESLIPTLKSHGLYSYFDFIQYSAATGLQKLDPKVYEQALHAAGGVDPADAGHVGDELISDYFAPRKIGMSSFIIDSRCRYKDYDLKDVDKNCVIMDLLELHQLIDVKS